jgi:hypothetical protein
MVPQLHVKRQKRVLAFSDQALGLLEFVKHSVNCFVVPTEFILFVSLYVPGVLDEAC